jgi:tyrosyl-tRNA synthetase
LTGKNPIGEAGTELEAIRKEIPSVQTTPEGSVVDALVGAGLASSNTEARRFIQANAVSVNGVKIDRENFVSQDFQNGRLLLRRGKAFKDSALIEVN